MPWDSVEVAVTDVDMSTGSPAGPVLADDDYLTVAMLASGLAQMVERRKRAATGHRHGDGLLPAAWRAGFSRIWWRCRAFGTDAPASDLELMEWVHATVRDMGAAPVAVGDGSAELPRRCG